VALPNAACPGLLRKPLDAAIGRLLTPYRPGGRQGNSKQYKDVICTHFDGRFNGHRDAAVLYHRASPDGEGPGLSYKPLNTAIGRTLAPIASIGHHNAGIWVGF
jgi:hypothetical protein